MDLLLLADTLLEFLLVEVEIHLLGLILDPLHRGLEGLVQLVPESFVLAVPRPGDRRPPSPGPSHSSGTAP